MTPTTDQLKDLLAKVTPGDWRAKPQYTARIGRVGATVQMDSYGYECARHDATLIALAPTLAAEVVRLREALNWIADHGYGDGGRECVERARQALDATSAV